MRKAIVIVWGLLLISGNFLWAENLGNQFPSRTFSDGEIKWGYQGVRNLNVPVLFKGWEDTTNVLQDCWVVDGEGFCLDQELENYMISSSDTLVFVWKHKIFKWCTNYLVSIVGFECVEGKVKIGLEGIKFQYSNLNFGEIPSGKEYIFHVMVTPPPVGSYDWLVVVETDDTNGIIPPKKDEDIDDICGANLGFPPQNPLGPVIFGPEPNELMDSDPGGSPAGRWPGENGVTRGWCFRIFQ